MVIRRGPVERLCITMRGATWGFATGSDNQNYLEWLSFIIHYSSFTLNFGVAKKYVIIQIDTY
jgi:hypothetical protein